MRAYEKKTDGRRKKIIHSSMKQCWNQGNEIIFISWKNIFDRKMKDKKKLLWHFLIKDVHIYELASVCDKSQTEPDLNHFQSLKGGFISKWHPGKIPHKELYNSWFCQNQDITVIILQLASYCVSVCVLMFLCVYVCVY